MQVPNTNSTSTYRETNIPPENMPFEAQSGETQTSTAATPTVPQISVPADTKGQDAVQQPVEGSETTPKPDTATPNALEGDLENSSTDKAAIDLEGERQAAEEDNSVFSAETDNSQTDDNQPNNEEADTEVESEADQEQEDTAVPENKIELPPKGWALINMIRTEGFDYEQWLTNRHVARALNIPVEVVNTVPEEAKERYLRLGLDKNPKLQGVAATSRENALLVRRAYRGRLTGVSVEEWDNDPHVRATINQSLLARIRYGDEDAHKAFLILNGKEPEELSNFDLHLTDPLLDKKVWNSILQGAVNLGRNELATLAWASVLVTGDNAAARKLLELADKIPDTMDMAAYEKDPLSDQLMQDLLQELPNLSLPAAITSTPGEDFRERLKKKNPDGTSLSLEEAAKQTKELGLFMLFAGRAKKIVGKPLNKIVGKQLKKITDKVMEFINKKGGAALPSMAKVTADTASQYTDEVFKGSLTELFNTYIENSNSDLTPDEMASVMLETLSENSKEIFYSASIGTLPSTSKSSIKTAVNVAQTRTTLAQEQTRINKELTQSFENNPKLKKIALKNAGSVDAYVQKLTPGINALARQMCGDDGNLLEAYKKIQFKGQSEQKKQEP